MKRRERFVSAALLAWALATPTTVGAQACPAWMKDRVYVEGDTVSHAGAVWEAGWWTRGEVPGTTGEWGVWRTGDPAACGPQSQPPPPPTSVPPTPSPSTPVCASWDPALVYLEGDIVSWAGQNWRAFWWTRGETPGSTGEWGVWRPAEGSQCNPVDPPDADPPNAPVDPGPDPGPIPPPVAGTPLTASELALREASLTSGDLIQAIKASIATRTQAEVEAIVPQRADNPQNVKRVEQIISEADWEYLFPLRSPEYSYTNFLKAVGKFSAFCGDYPDRDADAICRKALATMFAHFAQETGAHAFAWPEPEWRQGLYYLREIGWTEDVANGYGLCNPATWQGEAYPCGVFEPGHSAAGQYKSYFGRGAKQLSYNYNYGPFSVAIFGDVNVLLQSPEQVADTWLNLASAIFFYVYPQPPKPSMLHVIDGTWQPNANDLAGGLVPGFGVTTQIINGGIECGGSQEHIQSENRIAYYEAFADFLGVEIPADEVVGCAGMARFDSQGAAATPIYWEQDWAVPNQCKLVSYQTPFSALVEGDYARCVVEHFDVVVVP